MGPIYTGDDGDSELALKEMWEARQQLRLIVGRYKLLVIFLGTTQWKCFQKDVLRKARDRLTSDNRLGYPEENGHT